MSILKYILFFSLCVICLTCKKKNDGINIQVFDPFLNQPINNAEVSLIEINSGGGIFSSKSDCKVIKTINTDADGNAVMESNKFRRNEKYDYFLVVSKAYDKDANYSCANHPTDDYLSKIKQTINKKIYYYSDAIDWKLNINDLNSGVENFNSTSTNSISIQIFRDFEYFPDLKSELNGDKSSISEIQLNTSIYNGLTNPVNPNVYSCCKYNYLNKIYPGRYKLVVNKNKSGLVTSNVFYENVLPTEQYQFNIIW